MMISSGFYLEKEIISFRFKAHSFSAFLASSWALPQFVNIGVPQGWVAESLQYPLTLIPLLVST